MARTGVIWRLHRGTERYEAVVTARGSGEYELSFFRNGMPLRHVWLAAGRILDAIEEALARREVLRAAGWCDRDEQPAH